MSQKEHTEPTYIKNREIAAWYYTIDANPPGVDLYNAEERAPWFANLVSCVLSALTGFAQANSIEVTTDSQGEDSFAVQSDTVADLQRLDSFLKSTLDVARVKAWLSLKCVQINDGGVSEDFFIHNNGWLSIENNISKHGSVEEGLICVCFDLESNIYSPIARFDNRALAALNAPRLRNFLHCLEAISSLKFKAIDDPVGHIKAAERYGVVDRYGFKMPDDPSAFEELLKREAATW